MFFLQSLESEATGSFGDLNAGEAKDTETEVPDTTVVPYTDDGQDESMEVSVETDLNETASETILKVREFPFYP